MSPISESTLWVQVSTDATRYGNARDDASAVSLHLRAIAHVLPWYPSAWLMDGWEAQTCGLGPLYVQQTSDPVLADIYSWSTTLISIGIHLGNMHMVHTANTVFELALQMQTLTAAELRQIYTRESLVHCLQTPPLVTRIRYRIAILLTEIKVKAISSLSSVVPAKTLAVPKSASTKGSPDSDQISRLCRISLTTTS